MMVARSLAAGSFARAALPPAGPAPPLPPSDAAPAGRPSSKQRIHDSAGASRITVLTFSSCATLETKAPTAPESASIGATWSAGSVA